jgi:ABC-type antimicrobial peptide transport system permease subunit
MSRVAPARLEFEWRWERGEDTSSGWLLRGVITLATVGLAIGVPTAFGTSKFVASFLYEMKPNDPLTLAIAVSTLVVAALLAGYVPARRAARIDPMVALWHE